MKTQTMAAAVSMVLGSASPRQLRPDYPMRAHAKTFKRNARSEAKRLRRRVSR